MATDYKTALLDELDPTRKPAVEPTKVEAPPVAAPAAPAAPDYTKRGQFATFNAGADDKYNRPWDQLSERYKMQTVLSNFDPNAGITPDVINALNSANINGARFSGSGDKLNATGLSAWENYDGREGIGDIIQGFKDPNNKHKAWGAWQPEGGSAGGGVAPTTRMPMGGVSPLLAGNPLTNSQDALKNIGGFSESNMLQQLIQALGGGR